MTHKVLVTFNVDVNEPKVASHLIFVVSEYLKQKGVQYEKIEHVSYE